MAEKSISFRAHLQSNTTDLLNHVGIDCTHTVRLVIGLVSQLAAYTEEGTPLSPTVFICNSIGDLIKMSGFGEEVALSNDLETSSAASRILKYAAPLCTNGWKIYVERSKDGKNCKFGVLAGSNDPASSTIDEVLFDNPDKKFPIVRISQNVVNKVEVRTSAGGAIEFRFNDDVDVDMSGNRTQVAAFASAACRDIVPPDPTFTGFMDRILSSAIRGSHGTLIVVVPKDPDEIPPLLADAVNLRTPIDIYERYSLHIKENKKS